MRGINFARLVVIAAAGTALVTGTAATAAAEPGATNETSNQVRITDPSARIMNLGDRIAPAQSAQARATDHASAPVNRTDSNYGTMAQGGFDRDHWWIIISKAEVIAFGVGVVCRAVFRGAAAFVCPPIVAVVNWALGQFPNAGGYWAELYTNGQVRVGTW